MLTLLHVGVVGAALGWPFPVERVAPVVVGLLFVVLGNLMPRVRSNFFIGIRTPWILSSETVWTRTHRVGGYLMVAVGILLVVAGLASSHYWTAIAIGGAFAMAFVVLVYSYVLWRAEQGAR